MKFACFFQIPKKGYQIFLRPSSKKILTIKNILIAALFTFAQGILLYIGTDVG